MPLRFYTGIPSGFLPEFTIMSIAWYLGIVQVVFVQQMKLRLNLWIAKYQSTVVIAQRLFHPRKTGRQTPKPIIFDAHYYGIKRQKNVLPSGQRRPRAQNITTLTIWQPVFTHAGLSDAFILREMWTVFWLFVQPCPPSWLAARHKAWNILLSAEPRWSARHRVPAVNGISSNSQESLTQI